MYRIHYRIPPAPCQPSARNISLPMRCSRNSLIREKRSAFLRLPLIRRKRSPFPISRGRLFVARAEASPLQGGEAPRSGDEGVLCAVRHNSQIREKRSAFLRLPSSGLRHLDGLTWSKTTHCVVFSLFHSAALHYRGRSHASSSSASFHFASAVDRALPARTIARTIDPRFRFASWPPCVKGAGQVII